MTTFLPHHPSCPHRGWDQAYIDEMGDMFSRCICPDFGWRTADLDETDEEVPVEVDGPAYEYACTGSIVCDPLADPLADSHGRECERVNQEARVEFYEDLAASRFGVVSWTGVGR